ncbi:hypothetical protein CL656_00630 [bacterium]|nr:hypothetical protein [bacterium]|tara:strand:+ start:2623 stop:3588 length:966 start_codon:yes stop_codon:yes gene_type:complete
MLKKLKILVLICGLFSIYSCYALSQTSVFLPRTSYLENSDIKFSVRVKNLKNSFLALNFNTNCHFRFRVYKNKQLVYPNFWYETCKGFEINRLFLSKNSAIETEFVIPRNTLPTGKYLVVNTVNNFDLRQVISFEVVKTPILISNIGEICGGYQNIQCDLGLRCDLDNKKDDQFGICKISEVYNYDSLDSFRNNHKQSLEENHLESLHTKNEIKEESFVSISDFYDTMYYLNPTKLYRSKSNNSIQRAEALSLFVKILYGEVNDNRLDGFLFADTIFSKHRKEIDFAYMEFLNRGEQIYFRPNDYLLNSELSDWIKSLNKK